MNPAKVTVTQNGRETQVYEWSLKAADEILSACFVTRIFRLGTDPRIYLAELITEFADQKP